MRHVKLPPGSRGIALSCIILALSRTSSPWYDIFPDVFHDLMGSSLCNADLGIAQTGGVASG